MIDQVKNTQAMPAALRVMFGILAIATLIDKAPWAQSDWLQIATSYAGALVWGLMAFFGYRPGWPRFLTMAVAVVCVTLVVGKLAGFAA